MNANRNQAHLDGLLNAGLDFSDTFPTMTVMPQSFRMVAPFSVSLVRGAEDLTSEALARSPGSDIDGWPSAPVMWNGWRLEPWPALSIDYSDWQDPPRTPGIGSLLTGFLSLASATDEQIARFALRRGPLGICYHGQLISEFHGARCDAAGLPFQASQERDGPVISAPVLEPVSAWRTLARHLKAILETYRCLAEGEGAHAAGSGVLWSSLAQPAPSLAGIQDDNDVVAGQAAIHLNALIRATRLHPGVIWDHKNELLRTFLVSADTYTRPWYLSILAPILVQQALAAVSAPARLYQCDVCGETFQARKSRVRGDRARICGSENCKLLNRRRTGRESAQRRRASQFSKSGNTAARISAGSESTAIKPENRPSGPSEQT